MCYMNYYHITICINILISDVEIPLKFVVKAVIWRSKLLEKREVGENVICIRTWITEGHKASALEVTVPIVPPMHLIISIHGI